MIGDTSRLINNSCREDANRKPYRHGGLMPHVRQKPGKAATHRAVKTVKTEVKAYEAVRLQGEAKVKAKLQFGTGNLCAELKTRAGGDALGTFDHN